MTKKLNRRELLRLLALGSVGGLIAACASRITEPAAPVQLAQSPSTPTPPPTATTALPAATSTLAPAPTAAESAPAATATRAATPAAPALAAMMAQAATQFLASLDDSLRAQASYAFGDAERQHWHWTTPSRFPRNGLPLRDMSQDQRALALALLQASVSDTGYQKALDIMSLQVELGNDPELYYVTVFGAPGSTEPWGWRFEGHHLSRNFTVVGEMVTVTPFFNGAWPTLTDAGLRAMPREEDAARELVLSLDEAKRAVAIFQASSLTQHVTQNQPYVSPLEPIGILASELNADQQALILEIIQTYLGVQSASIATSSFERIHTAGLEHIRFGWAGSLEPGQPQYYRLQGPTFLLEFDNSRNSGTHIHSVWRDFEADFGMNNLA